MGIYRQPRATAMERRYVEANPQALSNLLVVDIDEPDALMRAIWEKAAEHGRQGWLPNAVVENPGNGHAHAVWALSKPITRTEYARRKPLAFAAAVTEGLRRATGGDEGYSGLITKNPLHESWDASWWTDQLYSLDYLAARLEDIQCLPPASWRRSKRRNTVRLRKLLDLRNGPYVGVQGGSTALRGPRGFSEAVYACVVELNTEFPEPLPLSEVRALTKSISGWIINHSRMWADGPAVYEANFVAIQAARGRKGGRKSGEKRLEKAREIWSDDE